MHLKKINIRIKPFKRIKNCNPDILSKKKVMKCKKIKH